VCLDLMEYEEQDVCYMITFMVTAEVDIKARWHADISSKQIVVMTSDKRMMGRTLFHGFEGTVASTKLREHGYFLLVWMMEAQLDDLLNDYCLELNKFKVQKMTKLVIHLQPIKLNMSGSQDDNPPPPPPPSSTQTPTQQTPHTVSTIKLPILKKGEYDIWAMKMEHYLAHTDYPIWEVIQNGNGPVSVTTDTSGQLTIFPPKTAEEIVARERERKARTTLLMAIPEDHLCKTRMKIPWNLKF
ncbi:hypothetical protein Tco_0935434, partial [Tanacetum coccineum]